MAIITHSEAETEAAGCQLADKLKSGDCVALYGSLGSGKTAFSRGVCQGFRCTVDAHSPTYNIVNIYPGNIEIVHIDLYRVDSGLEEIGWDDFFDQERIAIIEWAEKAKNDLPPKRLDVFFKIIDFETREIRIVRKNGTGN